MKNIRLLFIAFNTFVIFCVNAQQVSKNEAWQVAVTAMQYEGKTLDSLQIDTSFALVQNGDTLLYEVRFRDNESVILSGNKACIPVLSILKYDPEGNRYGVIEDNENLPSGLKLMIDYYSRQNKYCFRNQVESGYQLEWASLIVYDSTKNELNSLGPFVETQWGQNKSNDNNSNYIDDYAYNYFVTESGYQCTRCAAGCVAVAMAQIIRYHEINMSNEMPHRCLQYNWNNMPNKLIQRNNPYYSVEREEVAKLIRDCGIKSDMHYCSGPKCSSGASVDSAMSAFRYFGYTEVVLKSRDESNWESELIAELNQFRPLFYCGDDSVYGGHAFVCDGYKKRIIFSGYKFHFNWGWNGNYDGWFVLKKLNPNIYNFTSNQSAIFNIYPSGCWKNIFMECNKTFENSMLKNYTTSGKFRNNNFDYIINNGAEIHLQAGQEILLTDGFYAAEGSEFTAHIATCGNARGDNEMHSERSMDLPETYHENERSRAHALSNQSCPMDISIYPNPVTGAFSIRLCNSTEKITSVEVFNIMGCMVLRQDCIQDNINVSALHKGLYLVRVRCGSGKVCYGKFVKEE